MAFHVLPNPYDPGYAIPKYIRAEPPGRGVIVTQQAPRGTYDEGPVNWSGGYNNLPDYIKAEASKRGARGTQWAPRRTIPLYIPDSLGGFESRVEPEGQPYQLAGDEVTTNPIQAYGQKAASYLLSTLGRVSPAMRLSALKALLDELEPGLYGRVMERTNQNRAHGMKAQAAVQNALSTSLSDGFLKELISLGQGKKPKPKSLMGLGCACGGKEQALSGIWDSIKSAASKIVSAPVTVAKTAYSWGSTGLDKLGSLACSALKNDATTLIAAGGAAAAGAPPQAGALGAQIGKGVCTSGEKTTTPAPVPVQQGLPDWALPVGIGAAGLVAFLIISK